MARYVYLTIAALILVAGYVVAWDSQPQPPASLPSRATPAASPANKQVAGVAAAEPLASFPMGPERMPFVTLSLGGKDYHCLLDTGAVHTILNESLRSLLGDPVGSAGNLALYRLPNASIGSFQIAGGTLVACHNFDHLTPVFGAQVDVVVGMDILCRVTMSLNYDDGVVTLHRADHQPADSAKSVATPCMPCPCVMADVCGEEHVLTIDSGSTLEVGLGKVLADSLCNRGLGVVYGDQRSGVWGGEEISPSGLLAYTAIQGFRHPESLFVQCVQWNEARWEGHLGQGFLARYNSTLRFADNEMLMTKSKWHAAQWWPILRGMTIADLNGRRVVFSVTTGSSAFRAGVRPNDEVDVPPDFLKSLDLWETAGALALRIRKVAEGDFATVSLE